MKFKFSVAVILIACMFNSVSFGLSTMGTPTTDLDKGQWSIGFDYSRINIDLKLDDMEGTAFFNKNKLNKIEAKSLMAELALGIFDQWEIIGGFGVAEAEYDERVSQMSGSSAVTIFDEHESDDGFSAKLGTKVTFLKKGPLKLGALLLANWDTIDGTYKEQRWTDGTYDGYVQGDLNEDFLTIKVAPGASFNFLGFLTVYGGPFWQWINGRGHADVETDTTSSAQDGEADIKQDSSFGGWIGFQAEIPFNLKLNVEFQKTSSSDALGISLVGKF